MVDLDTQERETLLRICRKVHVHVYEGVHVQYVHNSCSATWALQLHVHCILMEIHYFRLAVRCTYTCIYIYIYMCMYIIYSCACTCGSHTGERLSPH